MSRSVKTFHELEYRHLFIQDLANSGKNRSEFLRLTERVIMGEKSQNDVIGSVICHLNR